MLAMGYGVTLRGRLLVRTVSETALAAMLNGLALEFDLWPNQDCADEEIRRMWLEHAAKLPEYNLVSVALTPLAAVDAGTCALMRPQPAPGQHREETVDG